MGISAPQILEFDVALGHFDVAWPKLWHKNVVSDQILGCSGHFDVKWAPVALKAFYRYGWVSNPTDIHWMRSADLIQFVANER